MMISDTSTVQQAIDSVNPLKRIALALKNPIDTIREVLIWWFFWIILCSFGVAYIEGWKILETAWWSTVTTSTTGYGDIFPKTNGGRLLTIAFLIGNWFFDKILSAQLAAKLIVNSDAWSHDEQEEMKTLARETRSLVEETNGLLRGIQEEM